MWCSHCDSDVATELAKDGQSLVCTTCGHTVEESFRPSLHPETQAARDLLKNWADELNQEDEVSEPVEEPTEAKPKPKFRVDQAHESHAPKRPHSGPKRPHVPTTANVSGQTPAESAEVQPTEPVSEQTSGTVTHRREDSSHASVPSPHFDPSALPQRTGHGEVIWGQLMAYAGVGVLTVGSVLVLWGYFGNIESYASTGWLVTTAGQMLLLLGMVTLVGGGMQQATHEVSTRIENLGGRITRIEESTTQILKGPHFDRQRETADKSDQQEAA